MDERGNVIVLGGEEYELLLTTRATKEIAKKYGGLDKLGEGLMKSEDVIDALDEVIWIMALLINQGVAAYNLKHDDKKKEITVDEIELLTSPGELVDYQVAIMGAMSNGMKRNILSEKDKKNVEGE